MTAVLFCKSSSIVLFAESFHCISANPFHGTGNQQNFLFNQTLPGQSLHPGRDVGVFAVIEISGRWKSCLTKAGPALAGKCPCKSNPSCRRMEQTAATRFQRVPLAGTQRKKAAAQMKARGVKLNEQTTSTSNHSISTIEKENKWYTPILKGNLRITAFNLLWPWMMPASPQLAFL